MPIPFRKIHIMLSSRNKDLIPAGKGAVSLEQIRTALQSELSQEIFCGQSMLEVWINETAGAAAGAEDAWQKCMSEIDGADLVIVIYNGHAGWTKLPGGIGICHAEFHQVWSLYPSKLHLVSLEFKSNLRLNLINPAELSAQTETNRRFREEIDRANIFRGKATDADSLKRAVKLAIANGISELVHLGSLEGRKGKYHLGNPLNWSRLDYIQRSKEIVKTVQAFFEGANHTTSDRGFDILELYSKKILLQVHGIPSGFGIAEARELVGRPYLHDYKRNVTIRKLKLVGPVHLLACHKKCTESQVTRFMGHPDLFMVQAPFGFFVADQTSFVQAFFLLDCRDENSTDLACQRLLDWIDQSGEAGRIVERATSRAKILSAVAKEIAESTRS
jgi:hypothetical protein